MFVKWNEKSLANYDEKVKAEIHRAENEVNSLTPYIGKGNSKTDCIEEGTSAGICGTCPMSCRGNCRESCYAICHQDGIYSKCRINHANNTALRRKNAVAYYETFFQKAFSANKPLRINESGDFENSEQVFALIEVAKKYPTVRVIGYTHRESVICACAAANNLPNVKIHFSVAINGNRMEADNCGCPCASITFDPSKVRCLNQLFKGKGQKWTCRMCAEKGIGCFSKEDIYFLAH